MREKLRTLIGQVQDCGCDVTDVVELNHVENDVLVDWLIQNGVVIPVRCKECEYWKKIREGRGLCKHPTFTLEDDTIDPLMEADDFCSYGEKRNG